MRPGTSGSCTGRGTRSCGISTSKSRTRLLRPTVLVDYDREAYLFQDVRITFDHNLHTGQYGVDLFDYGAMTLPVLPDDRVILEVKFDEDLPYAVRQLLKPVARRAQRHFQI